jgi:hypothetical protein
MHLDQIRRRFDSLARKELVYRLAPGATLEEIRTTEVRLGLEFPEEVANFWKAFNGLEVSDPPFKIMSLSEMNREADLLTFSLFDRTVRMAFDIRGRNVADQWSIVNADTNYVATLTIASFLSVHMWSWIVKRRPIWHDVHGSGG